LIILPDELESAAAGATYPPVAAKASIVLCKSQSLACLFQALA